jgi:glycosidase
MDRTLDVWRATKLDLAPGDHRYAIIEDGVWLTDRNVPTLAVYEGREVSYVDVGDCRTPELRVTSAQAAADGTVSVAASFVSAQGGPALDPASLRAVDREGRVATVVQADAKTGVILLQAQGLERGKYTFELRAKDQAGRDAEPALATAWVEPQVVDPRDMSIYQVVLDRFRNERGPVPPPASPSDRAGGNLEGFRAFMNEGGLERLGKNAVWLSPLYENPEGYFIGLDGRLYSSYHGYWPKQPRALDPRVATPEQLNAFVRDAHKRGIRVIFDVVPNHVHDQHPYAQLPGFVQGSKECICGVGSCDWASHIQSCWFAPYMPDLDWTNLAVARQVSLDVRWWLDTWDGDGVRIDAVPMMPRAGSRRIADALRKRFDHPGNKTFVLGENFTGPGAYQLLKYHIGPQGLDSQFHFPLMWSLRFAVAEGTAPMSQIDQSIREGEVEWAGSGAVMGTMIGNHDVSRFASVSAGQTGGDSWEPAPQPTQKLVYDKQQLALGLVYALPGAPVLYYGDEVGLAGKSDPDTRRAMPRETDLSDAQRQTRAFTERLGQLRKCSVALRRGAYQPVVAADEQLSFLRKTDDGARALILAARKPAGPMLLSGELVQGTWVDALRGTKVVVSGNATVAVPDYGLMVLLPEGDACLTAPQP